MIVILDFGMGNLGSIYNMVKKTGCSDVAVSRDYNILKKADKMILPGVGAFDAGMKRLEEFGLTEMIYEHALEKKKPLLGICLGMQLLGTCSEEGTSEGLGLIPFHNKKFDVDSNRYKVPHMGWNYVNIKVSDNPLTVELGDMPRFYFVHSYHAVCKDAVNILMTSEYAYEFTASVVKENIYGTQFHPEKSHIYGLRLMENFVKRC